MNYQTISAARGERVTKKTAATLTAGHPPETRYLVKTYRNPGGLYLVDVYARQDTREAYAAEFWEVGAGGYRVRHTGTYRLAGVSVPLPSVSDILDECFSGSR